MFDTRDPISVPAVEPASANPPWTPDRNTAQAMARVIVLMMLTDAEVDERELEMLERVDAFGRLGLSRAEFMRVARDHCADLQRRMGRANHLRLDDRRLVDEVLGAVSDPAHRLTVCRIAAAIVTADGRVHDLERTIYDHMLARWGLTRRDVQAAILAWPAH